MADTTFFEALWQDTETIGTLVALAKYILAAGSVLIWTAAAAGIWYLCATPDLRASGAHPGGNK